MYSRGDKTVIDMKKLRCGKLLLMLSVLLQSMAVLSGERDLLQDQEQFVETHKYRIDSYELSNYIFSKLGYYCGIGDLEMVKRLVEQGTDIEDGFISEDDNFFVASPLLAAILETHIDVIKYLISVGINVNAPYGASAYTPLVCAIRGNDDSEKALEIVKLLLDAGANPDGFGYMFYDDVPTYYPIIEAVKEGGVQIVELLVKSGVNFKFDNSWEPSILQLADQLPDKQAAKAIKEILARGM